MSLPHLPTELQDLIVTDLHPTAAIAFSRTNHHYRSTISLHRRVPDTVRRFLFDLERLEVRSEGVLNGPRFACYKWLCMKPGTQLEYFEVVRSCSVEYRGDWHDRQCLECDLKDGLLESGRIVLCWCGPSTRVPGIVCNDCFKAQGRFCGGCRSCAGCLEKKVVKLCADCDWCDACLELKLVEWESRKNERANEDDGEGFFMSRACKHHVPEYWKVFELNPNTKGRPK